MCSFAGRNRTPRQLEHYLVVCVETRHFDGHYNYLSSIYILLLESGTNQNVSGLLTKKSFEIFKVITYVVCHINGVLPKSTKIRD